jgi:hypothetical protein
MAWIRRHGATKGVRFATAILCFHKLNGFARKTQSSFSGSSPSDPLCREAANHKGSGPRYYSSEPVRLGPRRARTGVFFGVETVGFQAGGGHRKLVKGHNRATEYISSEYTCQANSALGSWLGTAATDRGRLHRRNQGGVKPVG